MLKSWLLLFLIIFPFVLQAQDMARVRKNIEALCAPEMHGRGYVNDGDKKAATFIQKQFQEAGLKQFNNSHLQTFSLPVNTISEVELKIDEQKLKPGLDFIPDAAIKTGKGKLKIQLLDTLIFSDEKRGEAFLKQNLSGKALLIPEK